MKSKVTGHLAALFSVIVWGTTLLSTSALLGIGLTPIEIMAGRIGMAFLLLNLMYFPRMHLKNKWHECYFALSGLCGVTLYFLLENSALRYISSPVVGIIISTAPFFTAIIVRLFSKKERFGGLFFVGFCFAMAGIVLISLFKDGKPSFEDGLPVFEWRGTLMAIGAAVCWGAYSVLTKKIGDMGFHPIQTTRRIFFWGLLFVLPFCFFGGNFKGTDFLLLFENKVMLLHLLYLGVVASAFCFVTWNYSLDSIGAIGASVYLYAGPVVTVIFSAIVDKNTVSVEILVGVVLAVAGLAISSVKK